MTLSIGHEAIPQCFGKDDEYTDTSPHCKTCPFQQACSNKIRASINNHRTSYLKPHTSTTRNARQMTSHKRNRGTTQEGRWNSSTPQQQNQVVSVGNGNLLIRPARFNHNKPLGSQYVHYVMYDTAESMATRAVELIRSCREEYERSLHEEDEK